MGVLGLIAALLAYAIAVARVLSPLLNAWPLWASVPVYIVLGLVWLLPLRRFMVWMETGSWR